MSRVDDHRVQPGHTIFCSSVIQSSSSVANNNSPDETGLVGADSALTRTFTVGTGSESQIRVTG